MKTTQHIASLILILAECRDDAEKIDAGVWGSKVAGIRVRRNLQIVERELKGLRANIITVRKIHKSRKDKKKTNQVSS